MRRVLCLLTALLLAACMGTGRAEEPLAEAADKAADPAAKAPVRGYILVTAGAMQGWLPLAAAGTEYEYPLVQLQPDGTEMVNIIHITDCGMYIREADCEGQDCVEEGYVTLENRSERVLGSYLICLPHQLMLQLFSVEELVEMYGGGQ